MHGIRRFTLLFVGLALMPAGAALAQSMAFDFTWKGIRGCTATPQSPAFTLVNVPEGTASLLLTLFDSSRNRELGGQEIAFAGQKKVPPGAIYTLNPCLAGDYTWTLTAKDDDGSILAVATSTKRFPGR